MTAAARINEAAKAQDNAAKMSISQLLAKHTGFKSYAPYSETAETGYIMTVIFDTKARSKSGITTAVEKQEMADRLVAMGHKIFMNGRHR